MAQKMRKPKKGKVARGSVKPKCGLCGKSRSLTKTDCCANWICDDEHKYLMFSYARNSCHRNHRHYTLCAYHDNEEHNGDWKECDKCRHGFPTEIYVWYGTNEYNFEKLRNPPTYEPTQCSECGTIIVLSEDEYSKLGKEYWCGECIHERMQRSHQPKA